jgi:hypothetical protein
MNGLPRVGNIVHYVSRGSADGEYSSQCRAAIVTAVSTTGNANLAVLNPEGMYFTHPLRHSEDERRGGTWHWPEEA